jgi:hypothetical protein
VKLKQITEEKKATLTIAAMKAEGQAVDALYAKELALTGLTLTKKQQIRNKELAFNDGIALKTLEVQVKAAEASAKAWEATTKTINSAFDSQISGLLHGTTSLGQATKNVLATMTEDLIKFFVNQGLLSAEDLARHSAMKLGILASDESTQAAATGAHATGAAAQKAIDSSTIFADDSRAAAGAYAAMAGIPIIGPELGSAAAAAAYGGALAFNSFDAGAWTIRHDQLALVHQNELIMPAAEAGAFRSMLSSGRGGGAGGGDGGGPNVAIHLTVNIHTLTLDGASVNQFWRNNQRGMMRAVDEAVRHGAHLGLKRIGA